MRKKFDDFDKFSKEYREIHNKNIQVTGTSSDYFSKYKVELVKQSEKNKKIPKILDLGCGDGNSLKFFLKHFKSTEFFGVDVSKESIKVAKLRKIPKTKFLTFNGLKLPFKDNEFDIVFLACVFHHIKRKYHAQIALEIFRVLKDKGRVYIFEHNPKNPLTQKVVKDCVFDKDVKLIPAEYFLKLLKRIGFKQVEVNYTLFFPRKSFFKKILSVEKYLKKIPYGGQYFIRGEK